MVKATFIPPDDNEAAMLEIVSYAGPTSRLACQIRLTAELNGFRFRIPQSQG
jgi:ferredoxin